MPAGLPVSGMVAEIDPVPTFTSDTPPALFETYTYGDAGAWAKRAKAPPKIIKAIRSRDTNAKRFEFTKIILSLTAAGPDGCRVGASAGSRTRANSRQRRLKISEISRHKEW
jgi:hypothetical protein